MVRLHSSDGRLGGRRDGASWPINPAINHINIPIGNVIMLPPTTIKVDMDPALALDRSTFAHSTTMEQSGGTHRETGRRRRGYHSISEDDIY